MDLFQEQQWESSIKENAVNEYCGRIINDHFTAFGTGFIGYLTIPVLTAIVISALLGATEFELAVKLWKVSRTECFIFWGAFIGVLLLGTINGVLIGIILSFAEMVIRSSKPASCFLGIQPGHKHFRDLAESSQIHEIEGIVIYRFSSNLFLQMQGAATGY